MNFNMVVNNPCVGGCVMRDGGRVSWVTGDPRWWDKNCAPDEFSRVCCPPKEETDKPTASPTWLDDSWGGDKWDGGSSSSNKWNWSGGNQWNENKWGWSGGSNNNKWGWSGGSSSSNNNWSGGNQWNNDNNNNKWGWSGGSKNDDWGGWEP